MPERPDLAALLDDSTRAAEVPLSATLPLLHAIRAERSRLHAEAARLDAVEDALVARLATAITDDGDHLLTLDETVHKLRSTQDWVRRNGKRLGIAVTLSDGQVRYSARAVDRLIASRLSSEGAC